MKGEENGCVWIEGLREICGGKRKVEEKDLTASLGLLIFFLLFFFFMSNS